MWIEILLLVVVLSLLLYGYAYRYVTKNFGRWEKKGIPAIPGEFPWGSSKEVINRSKHGNVVSEERYVKFKGEKVYGSYLMGKPVLTITDPETIRHVLVKDFDVETRSSTGSHRKIIENFICIKIVHSASGESDDLSGRIANDVFCIRTEKPAGGRICKNTA